MSLPNDVEMVDPNDNRSTKWSKLTSDWLGFAYRLLDCVLLFGVIIFQNCWISYYITSFNGHNNGWYFLFLVDFVMVFLFMSGAINAVHYYRKLHVFKRNQKSLSSSSDLNQRISNNFEIKNKIFNIRLPQWMGALPLIWICWLLYVIVMSVKIFVLHLQNIAIQLYISQSVGQTPLVFAQPHTIRLCLGAMTVVFLLWIEVHRNHLSNQSMDCIKELTTTVVFEIFDSIDLLDLLIPESPNDVNWDSSHSERLSIIILVLATINLLLPTIGLFRLSQNQFDSHKLGLRMNILHNSLRIIFVNIPYLLLRVFFWVAIKREISIFLLKNALFLFVSIRHIVSEVHELRKTKQEPKLETEFPLREVPKATDE